MGVRPDFSWEYPVPDDEFWNTLKYATSRNFFQSFTPEELAPMKFDPKLNQTEKLQLLSKLLQDKLAFKDAEHAPKHLYVVNYPLWMKIMVAQWSMQHDLDNEEELEKISLDMLDKNPDPKNLSALNILVHLREKQGRYKEAGETLRADVLPWMRNHETLGVDSPQALGTMRRLVVCAWKQGKVNEAKALIAETSTLIDGMTDGKFSVYQEDEKRYLADTVADLEKKE
jgi:hypothetical protein